jgi:hypothetical protein
MTLSILSLLLLAGAHAPDDAQLALYAPKLSDLEGLRSVLVPAGEAAPLLRTEGLRDDFHPLVRIDPTRPETATAVGVDVSGPATWWKRGELQVTCFELADAAAFETACAERLKTLGTPFRTVVGGVTRVGAKDPIDRVVVAYVLKGKTACTARTRSGTAGKELDGLVKLLGTPNKGFGWKALPGLPGVLFAVTQKGVVGARAEGRTLVLELKAQGLPVAPLKAGPSPFAGASAQGLGVLRLRVDPGALETSLAQAARMVPCPGCNPIAVAAVVKDLAAGLTGNMLVVSSEVKVRSSLRTTAGRFFAVRFAALAETKSAAFAQAGLAQLKALKNATATPDGVVLQLPEGALRVEVTGSTLSFSNDDAALAAARAAVPAKASAQAHGAEFTIDPRLLAAGLRQVSLMEVIGSPELSGLLAASAELGPLLLLSDKLDGWLDSTGLPSQRAVLRWTIMADEPFAAPGASDAGAR